MKTYVSKNGFEFRIADYHRPRDGDVVYFTRKEFDFIKSLNVEPVEFDYIWRMRYFDHRSEIIVNNKNFNPKPIVDEILLSLSAHKETAYKLDRTPVNTSESAVDWDKVYQENRAMLTAIIIGDSQDSDQALKDYEKSKKRKK